MFVTKTMKKLVFVLLFVGIQGIESVDFAVDDAKTIRQLADKFSVTADLQATFLTKAKNVVGLFSAATPAQRNDVISSIEDARFGGTMPSIQADLDSLLATAKATPAGVAGTTTDTSSAATPETQAVASYLDRISGLVKVLDSYRLKQIAESDRAQVMTLIQGLFNDRGDSFRDERQRLVQVITNAKVLMFRNDATRKTQIDSLISQLSASIPFDVRLTYQKKLYSIFTPLTADQKARFLKHFQEMTLMVPTLTDISLNNDFRDLLEFADVKFFHDDESAHSIIVGLVSKVQALDPIFAQPFGDIITSLKGSAATLSSADLQAFVSQVQTLVSMRYGNKTADLANKNANATALQDFLNYLILLPPFSSYAPQLTMWLGMVKADNVTPTTSKFIDKVEAYLLPDFMVQTNDATKRATFMSDLGLLMSSRYGALPEETTAEGIAQAKQKLKQLLNWMVGISWFSQNLPVINSYLSQIDADPATGVVPGTATPAGTTTPTSTGTGIFSVSFGMDIPVQLTQLEQSLSGVVNDNQKEMFMLSLFDAIQRKTAASSADVTRMGIILTNARNNTNLGAAFSSYYTFLQAGLNGSFGDDARMQVYQDVLARVAGLTVVAEVVQEKVLDFIQYLVENNTRLSSNQVQQVAANISAIVVKKTFSSGRITDLTDMYTELSMSISGASGSLTSGGTTTSSGGSTPAATTPGTTSTYVNEQQREQTRVLLNARALSRR